MYKTSERINNGYKEGTEHSALAVCREVMRIPKGWVSVLAKEIIEELLKKELIELKLPEDKVVKLLEELMLDEFMVEDRLNEEVREILKQYDTEIEKGRLDYRRLFELTKQKLVKERNIIL